MAPLKKRVQFVLGIDLLIAVVCVLGIHQLYQKAGINARLGYEKNAIYITDIIHDQPPENLQAGDTILTVNGQPVRSIEAVEFILDQHSVGEQISLTVERDDLPLSVSGLRPRKLDVLYHHPQHFGAHFLFARYSGLAETIDRCGGAFISLGNGLYCHSHLVLMGQPGCRALWH